MHTSTTSTSRLDPWTMQDLQRATQGVWHQGIQPADNIQRIVTDSRNAQIGDAFLALKGERFDAHDFVAKVARQNASCAIVERTIDDVNIPQLIVADTRLALGHLGAYRRLQCQELKVVALTGSSGKTTTKEMLGSIFSRLGETLVTRGNLNNDLGAPIMLLELRADHRYAVIELGASHIGEIDYTSRLVQPDAAGILNIGTAHLGEFGGRDAICKAKSEIYPHIKSAGTAIIPAQDDYSAQILNTVNDVANGRAQIRFGQGGDVYATDIEILAQSSRFTLNTPKGSVQINLPFAGSHNVHNAEAATSFALAMDVSLDDIAIGLQQATGAKGRLNFIEKNQFLLIDDTYNANPTSMRAAAQVLLQQQGIKVMVMGDIGELGVDAEIEHQKLGQDLAQLQLDYIIAVGEYASAVAKGAGVPHCDAFTTQDEAQKRLEQIIQQHQPQQVSLLFKGSRYTHMEHLMDALVEKL